jgi:prevent-host-death family protein
MAYIDWQELRTNASPLLERVAMGESLTVTVDGRPVASLGPVGGRPRFIDRDRFVAEVMSHQADASLAVEVKALGLE